eukprot:8401042-Lingulodinium_polyedra.AAC.1
MQALPEAIWPAPCCFQALHLGQQEVNCCISDCNTGVAESSLLSSPPLRQVEHASSPGSHQMQDVEAIGLCQGVL